MELEAMALYKIPQVSWNSCDFLANNNQFSHEFQCPEFEAPCYYPPPHHQQWLPNSDQVVVAEEEEDEEEEVTAPKTQHRRRSKTQTNRRQQINGHLSYLHSLLPESYIQKGDEASILGGAISYVKELEEELQVLCAKNSTANLLLQDVSIDASDGWRGYQLSTPSGDQIQVTMASKNHFDLKLHSKWRPKLLPRFISQIESLMLITVLHFNLSRADQFVLCSLSLKVEDGSKFTSVKRIASVVNRILARIQEEDERV